ncbi:ParA family protein [Micromonospora thermarum]|uniref:ParA family protein n=1 Tax=Micromonospora thermarum TaxID=2720024 RepID=A0ABX0Z789_9ACTN|nr:ParA family protein [Micromonospora thermarum]NJP33716.1 ParA family protein [Micromonospora thermarum]
MHPTTALALPANALQARPVPAGLELTVMVACFKGGTGKTTTCWFLLNELANRGYRPLGVDADKTSQSLHQHYRKALDRGEQVPFQVISWPEPTGMIPGITQAVTDYRANALVVDIGGASVTNFHRAGQLCDELLIPLAPTELDMDRLPATMAEAAAVDELYPLNVSVLLVKTKAAANDARIARRDLAALELPVLDTEIPDGVFYGRGPGYVWDDTGRYADVVGEVYPAARKAAA